jgi:hypothetical protein
MKYLLMIHTNMANWGHPAFARTAEFQALPAKQQSEAHAQLEALLGEITETGELVEANPLADPATTRTVRVRDCGVELTDGPYIEAKEQLAGYFVVDCESEERACEIAARFPDAQFASVEVRPIMDLAGQEM